MFFYGCDAGALFTLRALSARARERRKASGDIARSNCHKQSYLTREQPCSFYNYIAFISRKHLIFSCSP